MIELSNERIGQILNEETPKKEELPTILRSIYTRYQHLYLEYFKDIDALNDDKIAELKKYQDETASLVKHYYLDIPMDVCVGIEEFERMYTVNMLGPDWRVFIFSNYEEFKEKSRYEDLSEKECKAEFSKECMSYFYEAMDYVFRDAFGTGSNYADEARNWLSDLLFGKIDKHDGK